MAKGSAEVGGVDSCRFGWRVQMVVVAGGGSPVSPCQAFLPAPRPYLSAEGREGVGEESERQKYQAGDEGGGDTGGREGRTDESGMERNKKGCRTLQSEIGDLVRVEPPLPAATHLRPTPKPSV